MVEALRAPRPRRPGTARADAASVPPLGAHLAVVRGALVVVAVLTTTLLAHLVVISRLEQASAQKQAFDLFRSRLAEGTAPIGPTDGDGDPLAVGAPVAYLEIPELGLEQVVGEGTSAAALFAGPGHRRDTPLPGQVGTSVLLGRRAAYGGPFGRIAELERGDEIRVTTGQGEFVYRVLGVRYEGDPLPAPVEAGGARLILATAAGAPFMPDGVVWVDADVVSDPVGGATPIVGVAGLPGDESALGRDSSTLWRLGYLLLSVTALAVLAIWSWHRWGRVQAWVVFTPPLLLAGVITAGEVARLLPNLS